MVRGSSAANVAKLFAEYWGKHMCNADEAMIHCIQQRMRCYVCAPPLTKQRESYSDRLGAVTMQPDWGKALNKNNGN